jgi:hypothetical protein
LWLSANYSPPHPTDAQEGTVGAISLYPVGSQAFGTPKVARRNHPRDMWSEAIRNSKSKLATVLGQPRQRDAHEIHRLKNGFMDAWTNHETKY